MFNRPNWQDSIRFHVTFCQVLGLYCILTKVCLPDFHLNSYRWELIAAIYGLSSAWVDSEIRDPPDVWTWRCLLFTFADSKQTGKKIYERKQWQEHKLILNNPVFWNEELDKTFASLWSNSDGFCISWVSMVVNLLSGESRWNGLPALEGVGVGDGMLMGRPESQRQGHKAQGINTLVMG